MRSAGPVKGTRPPRFLSELRPLDSGPAEAHARVWLLFSASGLLPGYRWPPALHVLGQEVAAGG